MVLYVSENKDLNMTIEALWTMQFHNTSGPASSAGVVVFETNRIFGGDSCYYYIGTYHVDGEKIHGRVKSVRFNHQQACQSVIGPYEHLDFQFLGTMDEGHRIIKGTLSVEGDPTRQVHVTLSNRHPLP